MNWVIQIAMAMLAIAICLAFIRVARGPGVLDRVLGLDVVATAVVGLILLLSLWWQSTAFLDVVLIFSLLGFLSSVSFIFYLERTEQEPDGKIRSNRNPEEPPGP